MPLSNTMTDQEREHNSGAFDVLVIRSTDGKNTYIGKTPRGRRALNAVLRLFTDDSIPSALTARGITFDIREKRTRLQ